MKRSRLRGRDNGSTAHIENGPETFSLVITTQIVFLEATPPSAVDSYPGYFRRSSMLFVTAAVDGHTIAAAGAWILDHASLPSFALVKRICVDLPGVVDDLADKVLSAIRDEAVVQGCERTCLSDEVADELKAAAHLDRLMQRLLRGRPE